MAGLVPAIHVLFVTKQDVDARHKAGHDERWIVAIALIGRDVAYLRLKIK